MIGRVAVFVLVFLGLGAAAQAAAVTVPYAGSFDEASVPAEGALPAGDYDTIGGFPDVGLFNLVPGSNTFTGSVWTPGDSSDAFLIGIGSNQTLTGAHIAFGTNLTPSAPMFAFPPPQWTLEESDTTPTIFNLSVGANYLGAPQMLDAPAFSRGAGIYNVLIGNGTFGCCYYGGNYDTPIAYTMTFDTRVEPAVTPLPAALPLFLTMLAGMSVLRWRRNKAATAF